ncbi:hypothetical protein LCGC14_0163740 [marine sediment metagenome]|uniref:Transglutaminase-like domain-containing protein n=1 Tax=marine sediment metagenome TaxID=412755 RepID=A0A0F9UUG2_9ZZZZ
MDSTRTVIRRMLTESITDATIDLAKQARKQFVCDVAQFGDCSETAEGLVKLLRAKGIQAKIQGGQFITVTGDRPGFEELEEWDHTWVIVGSHILDPTVDQFTSTLDVDLYTSEGGVYYSHPSVDGDELKSRYVVTGR